MGKAESQLMILILFTVIGGVFAIIEYFLYTNNIILNVLVTTDIPLSAIMFFTVFMWELAGVILAATR